MGEGLPATGRIDDTFARFAERDLYRSVTMTLIDQLWITTSEIFTPSPFLAAMLSFVADKVLFSVDDPFSSNRIVAEFLNSLRSRPTTSARSLTRTPTRCWASRPSQADPLDRQDSARPT